MEEAETREGGVDHYRTLKLEEGRLDSILRTTGNLLRSFLFVTFKTWIFSPTAFSFNHFLSVSRTTFSHSFRVDLLAHSWRIFLPDIKFRVDGSFQHLKNVPLPSESPGFWWEITVIWIIFLSFVCFKTFSLLSSLWVMMHIGVDFLGFGMFGVYLAPWVHGFIFCQIWEILSHDFFDTPSAPLSSSFPSCILMTWMVDLLLQSHKPWSLCSIFPPAYFTLSYSDWLISIGFFQVHGFFPLPSSLS